VEKLKGHAITLVFLPTNASWLNDVERVFADVEKTYWQTQMSLIANISKIESLIIFALNTLRKYNQIFKFYLTVGRAYGIPTVALRYFNVYGPRQSLNNPYTGVCAIFSARIKNGKPPLIFEDGLRQGTL